MTGPPPRGDGMGEGLLELAVDPRYGDWMARPLLSARSAGDRGEVPVGAVVVGPDGSVLAEAGNERELRGDPTAHAEMVALREAALSLGGSSWRLSDCTLVVTLEPCVMCAGAVVQARVRRVVFGAWDPKAGACGSVWDLVRDLRANHVAEVVGGVREQECSMLLADFFEARRLR